MMTSLFTIQWERDLATEDTEITEEKKFIIRVSEF